MSMPELADLTVDHVLILVRDLTSSKTAFERLGFFVTERGTHPSNVVIVVRTLAWPGVGA